MVITVAYTGMRWSEVIGLMPRYVHDDHIDISWKLYELGGRFYLGRPKDGSIRTADLPPFLAEMLAHHLHATTGRTCTCRNPDQPWCPGDKYVFLGPGQGHFRRSSYGERFFRPATDGWYPARGQRPKMPVLADVGSAFPGRPVPPWPAAAPGEAFTPPTRRGVLALRRAGATHVSLLVVARWIKEDYGDNARFLRDLAGQDYDPEICPWTGGSCPPRPLSP